MSEPTDKLDGTTAVAPNGPEDALPHKESVRQTVISDLHGLLEPDAVKVARPVL
jgi:hypothetical protein